MSSEEVKSRDADELLACCSRFSSDSSYREILAGILPAATHYMGVQAFVDSRLGVEFGRVNGALASGLRALLDVSRSPILELVA